MPKKVQKKKKKIVKKELIESVIESNKIEESKDITEKA